MKRLAFLLAFLPAVAWGQQTPGLRTGQVPTAAQWNSYFSGKADTNGGTLTNPTITGGNASNMGISGTITGNATWTGVQTFTGTLGFTNLLATGTSSLNGAATVGTSTAAAALTLNGPAGATRQFQWETAGSNRWRLGADTTAESGSNKGSRFFLNALTDTGTLNATVLSVDRQFGAIQINTVNPVTFAGSDPGTPLSTEAFRYNEFFTGTTTGSPLTFNLFWVRRDDVNDQSQGQAWVFQDDAACAGSGTCAATATFTASISGNVLTVTAVSDGALKAGDFVSGSGVTPTHINAFGSGGTTGNGSTGTYQLDNSLSGTVGSETMTTITPISTEGRQAIVGTLNVQGPVTAPGGFGTYNASRFGGSFQGDGGGTLTQRGESTQAMDIINAHVTGATNWDAQDIVQSNIYSVSGENFAQRYHLGLSTASDNGVQAGQSDQYISFAASPNSTPSLAAPYYGLQDQAIFTLGNNGASIFPLDATNGEIMNATPFLGAIISPRPPMQAWRGIDLPNVQFSDCYLCFGGFSVDSTGLYPLRLGITAGTNGPVLDAGKRRASVTSVASSSNGFHIGEQYPSRLGGIVVVDTLSGSAVATAHYLAGYEPYHKSGDVVQVAWSFAQLTAASGQPTITLRNTSQNIAVGDTVVAVGPSSACNSAIPGGTTVSSSSNGSSGLMQTITLSANLVANMTNGCMLSFQRTIASGADTDVITVGNVNGAKFTLNITWSAATQIQIGASVNTLIGTGSALATNATTGFIQLPTMAGAPTGTVGAAGQAAVVIDTTNKKLCYSLGSGTWECSAAFTP